MTDLTSPEVVQTLVEQHRRFLGFLERRVADRTTAEDLLQAAFVKSLERGAELRDDESATAWFYRLLRNALVDHYRRRDAERRAVDRHSAETSLTAPHDAELDAVVCACVHALIPTLKPEYAEILRAVEMEGAGVAQAAAQLGITAGNAAVRLHRARHALRTQLATTCGTCTEHGCLDCTCRQMPGPV